MSFLKLTALEYFPGYAYSNSAQGTSAGLPANPTKADSYFLGWQDSYGNTITASSFVAQNTTTLYAMWSEKITVAFQTNGGTAFDPRQYYFSYAYNNSVQGTSAGLPTPTKTNAIFLGWEDIYGNTITASSIVSQYTTTLYAKWSEKITVAFQTNGGTAIDPRQYNYGYAYNNSSVQGTSAGLPTPTKTNAIFMHWADAYDNVINASSFVEQGTTTLYAKWSEKFTVSFVNEGSVIDSRQYNFGYAYNANGNPGFPATPTKTGAIFMGWANSDGLTVSASNIAEQHVTTLYAKWSEKITIAFETNGGTEIASRQYNYDYAYGTSPNAGLPTPTKTNFLFMGWYDNPSFSGLPITNTSIVETHVTTLYAKWASKITVSFETNGGSTVAAKEFFPDNAYNATSIGNTNLPANPTKGTAYFRGWYATPDFSDSPITNASIVSASVTTLYARWAEQVEVTFIDYRDNSVQTRNFYHGMPYNASPNTNLPSPIQSTKPGFAGWYSQISGMAGEYENSAIVPNGDILLHARWCVEVNFQTNGGTDITSKIYTPGWSYNQQPNEGLPTATRANWVFDGWFMDEAMTKPITNNSAVFDGAHTLYAKWKLPPKVMVTFNTNGGTAIASKEYHTGGLTYATDPNTGLPTPTRANNNFEGWFLDEALTQPVTDISSVQSTAHTLYAKWKTLSMVTVTFNTDGGTAIESKEYQADGLTYATAPNTGLPTPTHTNSNFEGWFLDAALTQPVTETGTVLSVAHTLYAKWSSNSTPIRIPQLAAHSVNATAIGKNIVLQNLPQNAKVQVYSLNGKQIYSANPENLKILEIGVQTGVYIVKVNKQILQVAVNNRIR